MFRSVRLYCLLLEAVPLDISEAVPVESRTGDDLFAARSGQEKCVYTCSNPLNFINFSHLLDKFPMLVTVQNGRNIGYSEFLMIFHSFSSRLPK